MRNCPDLGWSFEFSKADNGLLCALPAEGLFYSIVEKKFFIGFFNATLESIDSSDSSP
jgi:hypothetical protein